MIVTRQDSYNIIQPEGDDLNLFFEDFKKKEDFLTKNHLFVDLRSLNSISSEDFFVYLPYAESFKNNNKTFIIISKSVDIDTFPEVLNIAPTLQEGEDILEMENIERDLGF